LGRSPRAIGVEGRSRKLGEKRIARTRSSSRKRVQGGRQQGEKKAAGRAGLAGSRRREEA